MQKGLVIVFTGDGKGKSSAALGIALRAFGHKMYVSFVQFIKSQSDTGESRACERLAPEIEFVSLGKGFVNCCGNTAPMDDHKKAAAEALTAARQRILSASWDIVVLDITMPGRTPPAPLTIPATRRSYGSLLGTSRPSCAGSSS